MHNKFAPIFAVLLFGCGPNHPPDMQPASFDNGQSYREAIATMCDVDSRAKLAQDLDPVERDSARADYINDHVKNPDGIELRTLLSVKPPRDRAETLHCEAKDVGLSGCALADALDKE